MKRLLIIFFLLGSIFSEAQDPLSRELDFVGYLIGQEEYSDAIYYMESHLNGEYPMPFRDSLDYLKGWSHYSLKELDKSSAAFLLVSNRSPFFQKSRFFAAYNQAYLGFVPVSDQILNDLDPPANLENLKDFELAGNSLLKRDLPGFDFYYKKIEASDNFSFKTEKDKLFDYSKRIKEHKPKSVVLGGLLSAIVPGAGKVYAGKTGEGISSFLIIAASGATAYENYHKLGAKHVKTIFFGSLFAVLYIGNIYGAVFTVKLANEEFNHEMDNVILFNMHIPLRNVFN